MADSSNRVFMRWFDVVGQVLCFAATIAYGFSQLHHDLGFLSFLLVYFVVGTWQTISWTGWLLTTPWRKVSVGRKVYLGLLGVLACLVLPNLGPRFVEIINLLLAGTGVLALYYLGLSIAEAVREGRCNIVSTRDLVQLD